MKLDKNIVLVLPNFFHGSLVISKSFISKNRMVITRKSYAAEPVFPVAHYLTPVLVFNILLESLLINTYQRGTYENLNIIHAIL